MYSAIDPRRSLGADAEDLFTRIMNINFNGGQPYKSILSALRGNEKRLHYLGVRRKAGTKLEGFGGMEIIAIDSKSDKITGELDMYSKDILKVLKHHKYYLGTRNTGMGGVCRSCMCFDLKALEGVTAPDVAAVEEVVPESAVESSETAALETADDDDVKFGE